MAKVFLGGTCNNSAWRDELIPLLDIEYFNPVVDDWDEESYEEELKQREICDFVLYTITKEMTGVYSIAEAVDDANKRPEKTVFCIIKDGFDKGQLKSLEAVSKIIVENGGKYFSDLQDVADFLNSREKVKRLRSR